MIQIIPIFSLYVHVPFCAAKCGYCAFYSIPLQNSSALAESYLAALRREAKILRAAWGGKIPVRTIYIGGGTPTVLSPLLWRALIKTITDFFDLSNLEEATVEANPCSLSEPHLALWRGSFVTRVSIGVQSLDDDELRWLGRLHNAKTALRSIEKTMSYGFAVSADLIFALPRQTLRAWRDTCAQILSSGVEHVSAYQLTIEPDTPLGGLSGDERGGAPDGYSFYRFAQWYMNRKGLAQYEISSFAKPGLECAHNLAYWRQENVLALGPSAWGYINRSADGFRYRNAKTLEEYITLTELGIPIVDAEILSGQKRDEESAILALRTKWGVDFKNFEKKFEKKFEKEDGFAARLENVLKNIPSHLVRFESDHAGNIERARLTPSGMRVGNAIWSEIVGE
ncbi:coproporphyrinogen III oxidase [Synergistales bacterium]|nr:coproporphyrinogen III oxidase [Synergistales bacterium]